MAVVVSQIPEASGVLASVSGLPVGSDSEHVSSVCISSTKDNESCQQESGLSECTDAGVHCYQGTKLLNTQWLKKRTPESFWGTVVSVSAFFKLLATVRSLVCGDRAHTNAPLSSTLNCLTQWK